MKQRGRQSSAALALVGLNSRAPALIPPTTLTGPEHAVWVRTVTNVPDGWIEPRQVDLLASYCAAVVQAECFRRRSRARNLSPEQQADFARLAQAESALVVRIGRTLRLTAASRTTGARKPLSPQSIEGIFGGNK